MKPLTVALLFIAGILPSSVFAQLNYGGINANFGVDGDTRANAVKYGPASGLIPSDDWFSLSSSSYNIIDTTNASNYLNLLQSGSNISIVQRMSVPLYSKVNGRLWLDAVYGRDYVSTNPLADSTAFSSAAKNGENPASWLGGTTNFPDKDDLVDVFAHMRRDGSSVYDSLWLFTGVSVVGTTGSRYFDIELYKNSFSYNSTTRKFSSAGTDAGHTQWIFDASGNIIQTGDMIVAVNYTPGSAPVVDIRIWVSKTTYTTITPAFFNFGSNFDGATAAFGYASILTKAGATNFGTGIANYSATAAQDTTYATPWGTENSSKNWGMQYQSLQLVEVGLNLTRIGVDPALYTSTGLNACQSLFTNIFFASRSSNSFASNMQDFISPLPFLRNPVMDYSLQPDTLRCNHSVANIQIKNNSTTGYYTWQTMNGQISGSNSDSSQISINKPGTYIVSASPAMGCATARKDTVTILLDTFPPVATISSGIASNFSYLQLYGGDPNASNYSTPFGGSGGLLWNWSGPGGFTSTIQNPKNDTTWGTYQLIVTEKRNGCKDTALKTLSRLIFGILDNSNLNLTGVYKNQSVQLNWFDNMDNSASHYDISRSSDGTSFTTIGTIVNAESIQLTNNNAIRFTDPNPHSGDNYYQIKSTTQNGRILYSNIVKISVAAGPEQKFYLIQGQSAAGVSLACTMDGEYSAQLVTFSITGQKLGSKTVHLFKGFNIVEAPACHQMETRVLVVALLVNNQMVFTQKALLH
jgi:hypothetical protein